MKKRILLNMHHHPLKAVRFNADVSHLASRIAWVLLPLGIGMTVSCGGGAGKGAGAMRPPTATVDAVQVAPKSYQITEKFPGTLVANTIVQLRPDVTGYLEAIRARDGSWVTKGQPLYDIDKSRYQAAYNQAEAGLQQAEADLSQKKRDLKRYQDLQTHDAIAQQVVEQAGTAVKTSQANVAAAKAALSKANTDLNHAIMRAPVSGKLGIVEVKIGDIINAGQTLINTVVNDKPMYADFDVPQSQIEEFTGKQAADKRFQIQLADSSVYGENGKLLVVNNTVDPNSGTIRVRIEFPNTDGFLKSGMNATVLVNHASDSNALAVPTKALIQTLAETSVYTLGAGDVVQATPVTAREQMDSLTLVKGLQPGARVVVDGLQSVRPGDTVHVRMHNQ